MVEKLCSGWTCKLHHGGCIDQGWKHHVTICDGLRSQAPVPRLSDHGSTESWVFDFPGSPKYPGLRNCATRVATTASPLPRS